ncbi:MAG: hypothetical protein Q9195_007110 [Heterodermia aff. obscurata]
MINVELDDKPKKIAAYNNLVHRLPKPNWALLRALSAFLIGIVNNSSINKMSVRNVGIVFSPTLNIPAPVFAMFLTEFDAVFGDHDEAEVEAEQAAGAGADADSTSSTTNNTEPLTPEDIRSPRRQMFSDIPTPSYTQDSFQQQQQPPFFFPHPQQPHIQKHAHHPSYEQFPDLHHTGLIPLQPSYETAIVPGPPEPRKQSSGATAAEKARRRESSMLLMSGSGGGELGQQRKSSMPMLRGG